MSDDEYERLRQRWLTTRNDPPVLLPREPSPPPRWYEYSHTATGLEYWARFLIGEPREFAYVVPRRLACRLLGRHNVTCRGRTDHPKDGDHGDTQARHPRVRVVAGWRHRRGRGPARGSEQGWAGRPLLRRRYRRAPPGP
ncbi:hypothetical protein ACFWM5_00555 [Streptomyces bobili]|uniref:hypothetical protein n=1 Tax=Streptomyces bobili TaxID=67280 RepID=UPI00365ACA8D